jgi:hypothetical protein
MHLHLPRKWGDLSWNSVYGSRSDGRADLALRVEPTEPEGGRKCRSVAKTGSARPNTRSQLGFGYVSSTDGTRIGGDFRPCKWGPGPQFRKRRLYAFHPCEVAAPQNACTSPFVQSFFQRRTTHDLVVLCVLAGCDRNSRWGAVRAVHRSPHPAISAGTSSVRQRKIEEGHGDTSSSYSLRHHGRQRTF